MRAGVVAALIILAQVFFVSCNTKIKGHSIRFEEQAVPATQSLPDNKGWVFVWGDEFAGAVLDRNKWEPEVSCWGGGNNEHQCYTDRPENIRIEDGVLKLIARPERFRGPSLPQGVEDRGPNVTRDYTSGKVRTRNKASWKYGRMSARIKLPKGQSTWPAFWMMPEDDVYGSWPLSGEIDIMEAINLGAACDDCDDSDVEIRTSGALHFGKTWPDNEFVTQSRSLENLRAIDEFHEFALEWGEGKMNWFVDGELFFTATTDDWYTTSVSASENANAPFDQAFHLMFNLAVGGRYPDMNNEKKFNPSSFPNELWVDWVRVYQCKADQETGRACLQ